MFPPGFEVELNVIGLSRCYSRFRRAFLYIYFEVRFCILILSHSFLSLIIVSVCFLWVCRACNIVQCVIDECGMCMEPETLVPLISLDPQPEQVRALPFPFNFFCVL